MKFLFFGLSLILATGMLTVSCKKDAPLSPDKVIDSVELRKGDSTYFPAGSVKASISGDSIEVTVPPFTDITHLVADFYIKGKSITPVGGTVQNFSAPVIYTVTAKDGSKKSYTVVVTAAQAAIFGLGNNTIQALDSRDGTPVWTFTGASMSPVGTSPMGGFSYSSPVLSGTTLYECSIDFNLYAIDVRTGKLKWKTAATSSIESTPCVAGGLVYFGSDDYTFYAVDTATGQQKWWYRAGHNISSSPVVANGMVYFGSDDSYVNALDAATGAVRWRYRLGDIVNASSPAIAGGILYIGCRDHNLYALDAVTGTLKWTYNTPVSLEQSNPLVVDGVVYIGGWYNTYSSIPGQGFDLAGSLYAVDALTGIQKWIALSQTGIGSDPVADSQKVYITCDDGYLYAVDRATGAVIWKTIVYANGAGPAVDDGVVYINAAGLSKLIALHASTGAQLWTYALPPNSFFGGGKQPLIVSGNPK